MFRVYSGMLIKLTSELVHVDTSITRSRLCFMGGRGERSRLNFHPTKAELLHCRKMA